MKIKYQKREIKETKRFIVMFSWICSFTITKEIKILNKIKMLSSQSVIAERRDLVATKNNSEFQ
jgi:hypothetical protein